MTKECHLIYTDFNNSVRRLQSGLRKSRTVIYRNACIRRFEITFELSWKLLKVFLADQGFVCNSPKSCLQQAFSFGLIKDNTLWIDIVNDRNDAVHTYKEKFAAHLYSKLKHYLKLFRQLEKGLSEY